MIDQFLSPHSFEAKSFMQERMTFDAGTDHVDEAAIAGYAAYAAFDRYLRGTDIFILPSSRNSLEHMLRRFAADAVHNAISANRAALQPGGYSRICHQAEQSIRAVLNRDDNVAALLGLHHHHSAGAPEHPEEHHAPSIVSN
ncbi:hypothetical protein BD626DRAFT_564497 [Schizophyllum amplum]|uniref:Uncharacterized protein n=1 Tax=Schizophyllum amplum TaxID=97359 RepID=A0A550CS10_9AGAR|nr:hypothetical protein BD626DRAFT_564497 [Auriculariopsis ampla]